MKKRNFLYVIITIMLPITYVLFSSNSNGAGGSATGGCSCHGVVDTNTQVALNGIPQAGYVPGTTYNVIVNLTNMNYTMATARAGFKLSVTGGTITPGAGQSAIGTNGTRHNTPTTMTNGVGQWQFTWQAPSAPGMPVDFNVSGLAANGMSGNSGDAYNIQTINYAVAPSQMVPLVNLGTPTVSSASAIINGFVTANNASTVAQVEYGLTTAYGSSVNMTPNPITGSTVTPVSATVPSLMPNTTYHYRITATNSVGTSNSADATFTTGAPLSVDDLDDSQLTIFPNPAQHQLNIAINEDVRNVKMHLLSLNGKVFQLFPSIQQQTVQADVSHFARGIYFVQLEYNGKTIKEKVILK